MSYMRRIIDWIVSLESGRQFRKWVSILTKIFGVLALIGAIVMGIAVFVGAIAIASSGYRTNIESTFAIIGSILCLAVNFIVGIIAILLYWNRANKISELSDESHFTLMPITVILIRLCGEGGFIFLIGTGIQTLVASVFGAETLSDVMTLLAHLLPRDIGVIVGMLSFVYSVLAGAVLLIVTYFIAELINLFVDMAINLKKIETKLSTEETR